MTTTLNVPGINIPPKRVSDWIKRQERNSGCLRKPTFNVNPQFKFKYMEKLPCYDQAKEHLVDKLISD